jgi:hypothetical protein
MRHTRAIATAILLASIAAAGCAARHSDQPTTLQSQQPAATAPSATKPSGTAGSEPMVLVDGPASRQPAVLADGRHPVCLTAVNPARGTITFDLIQWYFGADAAREAAKDHQESPPPNDYYIRNTNPKLRTLPTAADPAITVNNLLSSHQSVPVSLAKLATLTQDRSPVFWLTVSHGQVLRISEQWVP